MGTGWREAAIMHHICNLSFIKKVEDGIGYVHSEKYNKAQFSILMSDSIFIRGI